MLTEDAQEKNGWSQTDLQQRDGKCKDQAEVKTLKDTITELKNTLEWLNSRLHEEEEMISDQNKGQWSSPKVAKRKSIFKKWI